MWRLWVCLWAWSVAVEGRGSMAWRAHREVTIEQGSVRGYQHTPPAHYAFLGLPYARPPTEGDRFKAPEPAADWDGIFEATHRIKCVQSSGEGDENCLVVNIFVPEKDEKKLPVLVHVHDGRFQDGWGSYQPPERLLKDFIVVTFNYRLGVLGFLCLGTAEVPGNAGLKDQIAALYWIHGNIDSFGGNPNNITLYGTGAGATSIQLLILSGLTKGLFHQVILESGTVLSPASLTYDPYTTALDEAINLGYNDEGNIEDLIQFYQDISTDGLVNISTFFLPCVENSYYYAHSLISKDPMEILTQGYFDKVPLLIVYTEAEEVSIIDEDPEKCSVVPEYFDDLLPNNIDFGDEDTKYKMAELIKNFYFDEKDTPDSIVESYRDYINDIFMEYPIIKFATIYASKSTLPVYLMKFSYNVDVSEDGAKHGDVFNYIFAREDRLEAGEEAVVAKLLTLWKSFMKIGDPTPLTSALIPVLWQPLNPIGTLHDVDINLTPCLLFNRTMTMTKPPATQRLSFWDRIYNKFYKPHTFDGI